MTDAEISEIVKNLFDLTPYAIEKRFNLRKPVYLETASYGHFGRQPERVTKEFRSRYMGDKSLDVELFAWEKLDMVDEVKKAFSLK